MSLFLFLIFTYIHSFKFQSFYATKVFRVFRDRRYLYFFPLSIYLFETSFHYVRQAGLKLIALRLSSASIISAHQSTISVYFFLMFKTFLKLYFI